MIPTTARNFLTVGFEAATMTALATAINAWLATAGEITLVETRYQSVGVGIMNESVGATGGSGGDPDTGGGGGDASVSITTDPLYLHTALLVYTK